MGQQLSRRWQESHDRALGNTGSICTRETIHSQLNLRKNTLHVAQDASAPGLMFITFKVDVTVPATVTVYYLARELARDVPAPAHKYV